MPSQRLFAVTVVLLTSLLLWRSAVRRHHLRTLTASVLPVLDEVGLTYWADFDTLRAVVSGGDADGLELCLRDDSVADTDFRWGRLAERLRPLGLYAVLRVRPHISVVDSVQSRLRVVFYHNVPDYGANLYLNAGDRGDLPMA